MEETPLYKIPTIDLSAKSLLVLAQFGCFAMFTVWGIMDVNENLDYVFPVMMAICGLSLFLSVPNARMGATLGVPVVMVIMSFVFDESEIMIWAVFMLIMVGTISYLPALAIGDETLGIDDPTRVNRLGMVYLLMALFMAVMFSGLIEGALGGEITDMDEENNDIVYTLDSTEEMVAQAGIALVALGVILFILTGMMGVEIGQIRPWHSGLLLAGAMWFSLYMWYSAGDLGSDHLLTEAPFQLAISGLFVLSAYIGYEDSSTSEEE